MDCCRYFKYKDVDGIRHKFCTNEDLKERNHSNDKDIPCIGKDCGRFEPMDTARQGGAKKMKKRITACAVLLVFAVAWAMAYGQYGGIYRTYYLGDGWAGAKYCGTTKNLTIEEVFIDRWLDAYYSSNCSTPQAFFSVKLSKRQSNLLWDALRQYDYAAGEIYAVNFSEEDAPDHAFALSVQIEADGSCTWKGFTYDELD